MGKRTVVLGSIVGLVSVVLVAGCQRKPVAQPKGQAMENMPMHDHASMDQAQAKTATGEQTTCPVMGGPINKDIFIEYQGKKVYFCCNGCPDVFKADPQKYLSKLPQFAK